MADLVNAGQDVDLIQGQNGVTGGAGAVAANTPRVTLASDDPLVAKAAVSTSGAPGGVTVSTSATTLKASNAARKSIVITNNGPGNLYIGVSSSVTATGANMGIIVPPFGQYSDAGPGLYTGDIFGIYDQTAASQNVSVWERS